MAKKQIVLELLFCTILRPQGGSQATFADKNRFRLQRGRKLRDEPFLHTGERLAGGIVARGGGDAVHTILQRFRTERSFGNGGILRRRLLCQGESLFHHIAHGVVLVERGGSRGSIKADIGPALHDLSLGVVFAAGADEAALGIGLSLHHVLAEAVGGVLGNDGAIRLFYGGDQVVAVAGVAVLLFAPGTLVSHGLYATKSRQKWIDIRGYRMI